MKYTLSGEIGTNLDGYRKLLHFHNTVLPYSGARVELTFHNVNFFDANLSAILLGMIDSLKKYNKNSFYIDFKQLGQTCNVLIRNGFTSFLSSSTFKPIDYRDSTVPLKSFNQDDADGYTLYIEKDFLKHRGIEDQLTKEAYNKIKTSYFELFDNVGLHAMTSDPVYTCGQFYPQKREFKFSLVDLGEGFLKKINKKVPSIITDAGAIEWALKGNTTKTEAKGGGSGLKNILGYCLRNNAEFHITTGKCYWIYNGSNVQHLAINQPFKGTTIHLIFRY